MAATSMERKPNTMTELHRLSLLGVKAAVRASDSVMSIYSEPEFHVASKADHTPVTHADYLSDQIIREELQVSCIPVISEESTENHTLHPTLDAYWLVDPLDGTKEFIKRNGEFCINIALMNNHRPVIGIITIPDRKVIYRAIKGEGISKAALKSWNPGSDITFSPISKPKFPEKGAPFIFLKSKSHSVEGKETSFEKQASQHYNVMHRYVGSAIKFTMIAEGHGHTYHRQGPTMEWDTAAGHAMLLEFGGHITDLHSGEELKYGKVGLKNAEFIASLMPLHDMMK